jgi:hypothetical protein
MSETERGKPLRHGVNHGLADTPSWLFHQPGEMAAAEERLARLPDWETWFASNDAAKAKYRRVPDAPSIFDDTEVTNPLEVQQDGQ